MAANSDDRDQQMREDALNEEAPRRVTNRRDSALHTDGAPRASVGRRRLLGGVGALGAAGLLAGGARAVLASQTTTEDPDGHAVISLRSQTVAIDTSGDRVLVGAPSTGAGSSEDAPVAGGAGTIGVEQLEPGTRLLRGTDPSQPWVTASQEWLERTGPWLDGVSAELQDLAHSALLDLWVLSYDLPAPVAGWSPSWRYIWPRDVAFCAVAMARVGLLDDAAAVLAHLQSLQSDDGWFEARYDPSTDEPPDARSAQLDGTGLLLWATDEVLAAAESTPELHDELTATFAPLIERSCSLLLDVTDNGQSMPPATSDYWEVSEKQVTLWIMAATLRGLRSGSELTDDPAIAEAAEAVSTLLEGTFGKTGYQRYRTGGGADSAMALFDATGMDDVIGSGQLRELRSELERPGGGIAPGASWRQDGVSWTPSTSLLAAGLAQRGEAEAATQIMQWLAAHRTEAGSLPEKVLFDGRPAEVAPLSWTAANVLLTLDALRR